MIAAGRGGFQVLIVEKTLASPARSGGSGAVVVD